MFSFLGWLVIGFVAGLLARMLIPGRQSMGMLLTIGLGLVGSIIGGLIGGAIFGTDPRDPGFHAGGLIASTIGAMIVLGLYVAVAQKRLAGPRQ